MGKRNQLYRVVEVISFEPRVEKPIAGHTWCIRSEAEKQYQARLRKYPQVRIAIQLFKPELI